MNPIPGATLEEVKAAQVEFLNGVIHPVRTPPKAPYSPPWTEQLVTYTKLNVAIIIISSAGVGYSLALLAVL